MTRHMFYKVNGVLLVVAYFIGRILIFPFMYWSYSKYSKQPMWQVPFNIPLFCNLCCLGLLSLQMIWFVTISKRVALFLTSDKPISLSSVIRHYSINATMQDSKDSFQEGLMDLNGMLRIPNGKQK